MNKFIEITIKEGDTYFEKKNIKLINGYLYFTIFFLLIALIRDLIFINSSNIFLITNFIIVIIFCSIILLTRLKTNVSIITIGMITALLSGGFDVYFRPFFLTLVYIFIAPINIFIFFSYKKNFKRMIILLVFFFFLLISMFFKKEINNTIVYSKAYNIVNVILSTLVISVGTFFVYKKMELLNTENNNSDLIQIPTKDIDLLDDLFNYALKNDSKFIHLFTKMYPIFIKNIRNQFPQLNQNDLHFCALLFLNFSSTEISNCIFISIRSVQNKKYLLRKKMNLTEKDNLYILMKSLN